MTTILRYANLAIIMLIAYVGAAFVDQHYYDMDRSFVGHLVDTFPVLGKEWFFIVITGLTVSVFLLKRMIKIVSSSYLR